MNQTVTISLTEEISNILGSSPEERNQRAKEALALELYRSFKITRNQVRTLFNWSFEENEKFLTQNGLPRHSSEPNYEVDPKTGDSYFRKD